MSARLGFVPDWPAPPNVRAWVTERGSAARYCDKLCLLAEGQLLAFGTPREVLTEAHVAAAFQVEVHVDLDAQPPIILPK